MKAFLEEAQMHAAALESTREEGRTRKRDGRASGMTPNPTKQKVGGGLFG